MSKVNQRTERAVRPSAGDTILWRVKGDKSYRRSYVRAVMAEKFLELAIGLDETIVSLEEIDWHAV